MFGTFLHRASFHHPEQLSHSTFLLKHPPSRAAPLPVQKLDDAMESHLQRAERSLRLRAGRLAYEASQVDPAAAAGRGTRDPSAHATRHARTAAGGAYAAGGALVLGCAKWCVCALMLGRADARERSVRARAHSWFLLCMKALKCVRLPFCSSK